MQHPFLLGVAGLKAGKKLSIPVIFTYHTLYEHYVHHIPLVPNMLVKAITKYAVLSFAQKVDYIIISGTLGSVINIQQNNLQYPDNSSEYIMMSNHIIKAFLSRRER